MECQRCGSDKIVTINGKCSGMFSMSYDGEEKHGHGDVPNNLFFGKDNYGDYMIVEFCAECGQIQSKFPISQAALKTAMEGMDED